jgi:hypothetical protein
MITLASAQTSDLNDGLVVRSAIASFSGNTELINSVSNKPTTESKDTSTTVINFPNGFASSKGQIWLENDATLSGSMIHLVPSTVHNASNAWFEKPESVQTFSTTFTFHVVCPAAPSRCGDGFAFMIISNPNNTDAGFTYSGYSGGQFSWSQCQTVPTLVCPRPGQPNIHSIMVKFDLYNAITSADTAELTGFYTDGEFPQPPNPEHDMAPAGINMQSGHKFSCTFTYDGTTLKQSLTDTVTGAIYTNSYQANIPSIVLGNSAFIGFGGGTGSAVEDVYLDSWTYATGTTSTPTAAAPTFSVAAGTYTSPQTVSLSAPTSGSTIYYTTDGATPTTSSPKYTGAIVVAETETIEAIAVAPGYTNSATAKASYVINLPPGGTTYIDYPKGGFAASAFDLNGGATITPDRAVQLTDGGRGEGRSAWFDRQVPVDVFTTDFTFQQLNAVADGMTFTIQGQGPDALGATGGSLGYAGISKSIAIKFDLYNNDGEGNDSTGLYIDGAQPMAPAVNLSSTGILLTSGNLMHAHLVYNGINLTMTLTDVSNGAAVTKVFPVNIPSLVGGSTAYVGFTGGTGGFGSIQNVLSWTFSRSD